MDFNKSGSRKQRYAFRVPFQIQAAYNITTKDELDFLFSATAIHAPDMDNVNTTNWHTYAQKWKTFKKTITEYNGTKYWFRHNGLTKSESITNCHLRGSEFNCSKYIDLNVMMHADQCFSMFDRKKLAQEAAGEHSGLLFTLNRSESVLDGIQTDGG